MKLYIKSATNVSDIEAKIAKKQAEIDKKKAWIAKKEEAIKKKLALLSGKISDDEYTQLVACLDELKVTSPRKIDEDLRIDTWGLARKYGYNYETPEGKALYNIKEDAESIYNSKEAIKEAEGILSNYEAKIATLKNKADEIDRIPECLKDFMNSIIEKWNDYDFNIRDNSKPYYKQLKDDGDRLLYDEEDPLNSWRSRDAKLKELYPDIEGSWRRSRKFEEDHIVIPFEKRFGSLNYARSLWGMTDEQIRKENERSGQNLILDLLKRVTKITGPVTNWSGLHVTQGNMGAVLNGVVVGESGKARVESILAGGYNIQRLHVRTLVKEVK